MYSVLHFNSQVCVRVCVCMCVWCVLCVYIFERARVLSCSYVFVYTHASVSVEEVCAVYEMYLLHTFTHIYTLIVHTDTPLSIQYIQFSFAPTLCILYVYVGCVCEILYALLCVCMLHMCASVYVCMFVSKLSIYNTVIRPHFVWCSFFYVFVFI